ncbi:uncharacterized aarF domain-containing protein kinase 5 [Dendroctonus ponderosae]|uniref:ABC1 atypical kinase-like domain-containing protein n=1 Tax=Dendroctonus ponderosae TaxID=77166 RepID=U4UXT3_DENPD|nr:uncharacterized aarF domain-containing protein kinase 5 [Dendroctonus ponderosae]XP_019759214.2 uncharacterized aarF domain-containing protein kinase 5 [Dendroctonus ponderosae]XP_019759215.2 uncharacterized aarF domain-containing protein kinase 5 [Dendroctonus ponderosae]XP_048521900.1 uncharacterized aarF domain-containing protein kinase 5 [Dendroctonus ponderosae]ERL95171.1 hypothetical protein D910_12440 [Dendroctonus ponderosae]KAH1018726.1 hypothetical protein HUJ05_006440 [Dendrocton
MSRWGSQLIRKCFRLNLKDLSNNRTKNKYPKYIFAGISATSAAVAVGAVKNEDDIIVGAKGLIRFVRSIQIGLAISLDYYFSTFGLSEEAENYALMMSRIHQRCAERIRDGCLENGGTYVKLGQGIVSLSHILPKEYIVTLKVLQDKCLARNKEELYQVFQEDFGHTPEELFETFDSDPIAAASIAQVFKATTKEGRSVAVKVQYNDLQKRLNGDVMTINILLKIGAWLHPKVDFTWILNGFVDALKQELDFVNEGLNGERCARDLAHLKYVHVPAVLWNYTNTRVLVTEFIDGIKITDVKRLKQEGYSLADINIKLFESFGSQIFESGFVHADPHPGNIMIRKNNGKTQLIILDHGLYQIVPNEERMALSHLWKAIVLGDHNKMNVYSKALGVDDYTMFAEILTQTPLRTTGFRLKFKLSKQEEDYMRKVAGERFDQIVDCLQEMPNSLLLVLRNLNTIRAISYDLGNPIDRYAILARIATKTAFESENNGIIRKMLSIPKKCWFEVNLFLIRLVNFWRMQLLKLLYAIGAAPDVNKLIERAARAL